MLAVNEEFTGIMCEGLHTGIPMYFVRLQGCTVSCYFCDVKFTWKKWDPNEDEAKIVKRAKESNLEWVCITGGEPYQQNIYRLLKLCKEIGLKTHVETSGAFPMDSIAPDWLSLSPKDLFSKYKTLEKIAWAADEIKVIVTQPKDLDYYLDQYHMTTGLTNPYFIIQPVDTKTNDKRLIDHIFRKTVGLSNVRIMTQQNKVIQQHI